MLEIILKFITMGIPTILAITLHEAAHGYVALMCGDDTAKRMGRLTLNPLRHVDPFGTIILPLLLILSQAPFLFGYAKPVPVDFNQLNNPRRDMVKVAIAGPLTNLTLAFISALLLHGIDLLPFQEIWVAALSHSVLINIVLAVFNMLPLPPLDGGRVAVGLLPPSLAYPLARLEPYGFMILLGLMMLPSLLGLPSIIGMFLQAPVQAIIQAIAFLTGLH